MGRRRRLMTLSSAFCTASAMLVLWGVSSSASITATRASAAQTVTSVSWAVVGTTASSAPYGTSAVSLPFTLGVPQYFNVVNVGTATLSTAGYTIGYGISTSNLGIGWLDLYGCSGGTWNTTTGICSGTQTVLASTGPDTVSSPALQPSSPGALIQVKAGEVGVSLAATATVNVTVKRVGSGTTTNS